MHSTARCIIHGEKRSRLCAICRRVSRVRLIRADDALSDALRSNLTRLIAYAKSADSDLQRQVAEKLANEAVKRTCTARLFVNIQSTISHAEGAGLVVCAVLALCTASIRDLNDYSNHCRTQHCRMLAETLAHRSKPAGSDRGARRPEASLTSDTIKRRGSSTFGRPCPGKPLRRW